MSDNRASRGRRRRAILAVILVAGALLAARSLDFDVIGWLREVFGHVRDVPLRYVIAAYFLKTVESLLVAFSWRAVLQATFPEQRITSRFVLGAYAGGVGINAVTPAMTGTAVMIGLYRLFIDGAATSTILSTVVVHNITFAVLAALTWITLLASSPAAADATARALGDIAALLSGHPLLVAVVVIAIVALIAIAVRRTRHRMDELWQQILRGGAILRTPRRFLSHVAVPQVLSYACRSGETMIFMAALGIPVTVHSLFLVIGTNTVAKAVRVAPGGIGTTEALMVVALRDYADPATVTAFSLAKTSITSAWNVVFGAGALVAAFGVEGARNIVRQRDAIAAEGQATDE